MRETYPFTTIRRQFYVLVNGVENSTIQKIKNFVFQSKLKFEIL